MYCSADQLVVVAAIPTQYNGGVGVQQRTKKRGSHQKGRSRARNRSMALRNTRPGDLGPKPPSAIEPTSARASGAGFRDGYFFFPLFFSGNSSFPLTAGPPDR